MPDHGATEKRIADTWSDEVAELLALAEMAEPPDSINEALGDELIVTLPSGWSVVFWYQYGLVEGIDHFVDPDGGIVDFCGWPDDRPGRDLLMIWRRRGQLPWIRDRVAWHAEDWTRASA